MRELLGSNSAGITLIRGVCAAPRVSTCSVCGQSLDNDIRLLNHMMEKHGFRNPDTTPDRNSRGY